MIYSLLNIWWFYIRGKISDLINFILFPKSSVKKLPYERITDRDAYICNVCLSIISGSYMREKKFSNCPVCGIKI